MKPGQECPPGYLFQVYTSLVIIINKQFGGYNALVYVGGEDHSLKIKNNR